VKARSPAAFTLVELCVVVAIIAILAALLTSAVAKSKGSATTVQCLNNARQIGLAFASYADDYQGRLPQAGFELPWNSKPMPWTRQLLPCYKNTNLLACPELSKAFNRSCYNYFMGGRVAFVEAGGHPASVQLPRVRYPANFVLSGDCNYPFRGDDADPDNFTQDTLFSEPPKVHGGRLNVLFADSHTEKFAAFDPAKMTYSYDKQAVGFLDF
jgi:prepilin-type N-terminal cleavage/methylation domain-containing protein/prepilin-type processing-associated H-X9-DG protein